MSQQSTIQTILDFPIVPVFFNSDPNISLSVFKACYKGGVRAFEFTNRGSNALATFHLLKENLQQFPGYILGAGTVLKDADASAFIDAGASFIVSPCFV